MYEEYLCIGYVHGQKFDKRGVREVEQTRYMGNRKPQSRDPSPIVLRDSDGAYRIYNRLDGRSPYA